VVDLACGKAGHAVFECCDAACSVDLLAFDLDAA
jgi:hypothetical protein